ncbi:peptidase C25 [Flavobacterium sediminis]|uniref:Peptidase C25 n=1 Tax=Flavobacterium sediminis TaxID=2201181 RepID=A0A2U8QTG9_9FLAO|nr:type IX secretion system sortase PorU [Flavobacterium sediminis]AWM13176.1 peptidase C25 [Flavobacterium sediminis]
MKKIAFLFVFFVLTVRSQSNLTVNLDWDGYHTYTNNEYVFKYPVFKDKSFSLSLTDKTISSVTVFDVGGRVNGNALVINSLVVENVSENELADLDKTKLPLTVNAKLESSSVRDAFKGVFTFSPVFKENGQYKRVKSISFTYTLSTSSERALNYSAVQMSNSVLATGNWYRFYVEKSGVYRIDKSFLQSLGFDTNVDPHNIKIFGNGGRMIPLQNASDYLADLEENAIQFVGENDGVFNDNDYILFYAEGVDVWNDESLTSVNLYADKSYYYVTNSGGTGKRIQQAVEPSGTPTMQFTTFHNTKIYEKDLVNPGKIGRRWFGEDFKLTNSQTFDFNFPNLVTTEPLELKINLASQSYGSSSFEVKANGQSLGNVGFLSLQSGSGIQGYENVFNGSFNSSSSAIAINLTYNNGGVPSSDGFLDYIRIKGVCGLQGYGQQFSFFNEDESSNIGVGAYVLANASGVSQVWDVTDIFNVESYTNNGQNSFSFKVNLGNEKKYIAVVGADFYSPLKETNSTVNNQNLKGDVFKNSQGVFEDIDYLIITPGFLAVQAETLANFHRSNSGLVVKVVRLEHIYQEFGSGKQDIGAIRNFIRYVYDNASSAANRVKYVNLFGDASYDYKDRISNNNNIVPVFHGFNPNTSEVNNSSNFSLYSSFMSDDFYGLMDNGEGQMLSGYDGIDIAVGRMLVSSVAQAQEMVTKLIQYYRIDSYGRWRNNYVIYSDDADDQTDAGLQFDLDQLADDLVAEKPFVNVKKIHTDAYIQEVAAGGERYPDAKEDFLNAFDVGALVFNYYGHGNEEYLARERLFEKLDAQNLKNEYRFPLFITITCEFTRFDDPGKPTGGEYMFWNSEGGAIALIATTRQIGVTTGLIMNNIFNEELYAYGSYDYPTIGEALRLTKLQTGSSNRRVVFCVGDPALQLAIPKPRVVLTEVNDIPVAQALPPFRALDLMKVEGEVVDLNNALIADYNGDVAIQIFDKDIDRSTLGNDGTTDSNGLIIMDFTTLGETIFRGNASVVNGKFEISFVVPQDIRIPLGNGKISFYAKSESPALRDETGYDLSIQVGGVNENAGADTTPPTVALYMNDESFVSGEITNCSPVLIAYLEDEHGINTASGIGHDIVAILDGDEENPYILNDYYETELDDFTKGKVRFPFRDLESGLHTILFKAWDVYNNLITMEIQFNAVCSNDGLQIQRVLNYPNPFVSYTEFWFTHNMPFEPLDVQVQILTITGKLVKTINQQVVTDGFLCRDITWDGRDDFGDKIGKGVYVYKLTVKSTTTGVKKEKYEKLVIL